jgi:hypothetical protein
VVGQNGIGFLYLANMKKFGKKLKDLFSASLKINKKRKAGSFFRQAYFVAFTKLVKVV